MSSDRYNVSHTVSEADASLAGCSTSLHHLQNAKRFWSSSGQQRLKVDFQGLTDRVVKAEKQHTSLALQLQHSMSGQNQTKATLRNNQRQVSAVEAGQAKLQQEVTELAQAVDHMKGRKGPALPWQRAQEQVSSPAADARQLMS